MLRGNLLLSILFQHPFVAQPVSAIYNGVGVAIMRRFYPKGSLRDIIYGVRNLLLIILVNLFYSVVHKAMC